MADRGDPDVLEVVRRQLSQHLHVDVVVAERLLVALQPQIPQPGRNVHHSPHGSHNYYSHIGFNDAQLAAPPPRLLLSSPLERTCESALTTAAAKGRSTPTMDLGIYNAGLLRLAAEAVGAGRLLECNASAEILNPICGDRIQVYVKGSPERIAEIGYEVHACVLTQASASLLGRHAPGRPVDEIQALADQVEAMLRADGAAPEADWSDYAAFEAVRAHKSRHECVMLPLRALLAALDGGGSRDRGS